MKTKRIGLFQMSVPIEPFEISGGRVMELIDQPIVRIETDAGIASWGDKVLFECMGAGVREGLEDHAPKLIELNRRMIGQIDEVLNVEVRGQPFAKSAIDVAR